MVLYHPDRLVRNAFARLGRQVRDDLRGFLRFAPDSIMTGQGRARLNGMMACESACWQPSDAMILTCAMCDLRRPRDTSETHLVLISRREGMAEHPRAIDYQAADTSTSAGFNIASLVVVLMPAALYTTWW